MNKLKIFLTSISVVLAMCSCSAYAQSPQEFCDILARNANRMYEDVNSQEYEQGKVSYETLVEHYAGVRSQIGFGLIAVHRDILDQIVGSRGKVTAKDVSNYVYRRCAGDYSRLYPS